MAGVSRSYRGSSRSNKSLKQLISKCFDAIVEFFFPSTCLACKSPIVPSQLNLCISCECKLPWTDHFFVTDNAIMRALNGRLELEGATSLFYFTKGGAVQNLIHSLKFGGNKTLAKDLGKMAGRKLLELHMQDYWDYVVFVPVHRKRLNERGYNQSEEFAIGISESLGVPILPALERNLYQSSQTNYNRDERWQLLKDSFNLACDAQVQNKKVILVDDVFTTGATIEVCGKILKSAKVEELWVLTMAFTAN